MNSELIKRNGLSEADFKPVDFSPNDIIETLADQEYRICLLELGIEEEEFYDDL